MRRPKHSTGKLSVDVWLRPYRATGSASEGIYRHSVITRLGWLRAAHSASHASFRQGWLPGSLSCHRCFFHFASGRYRRRAENVAGQQF